MSVKHRREEGETGLDHLFWWPGGQGGMEDFSNLRVVRRSDRIHRKGGSWKEYIYSREIS